MNFALRRVLYSALLVLGAAGLPAMPAAADVAVANASGVVFFDLRGPDRSRPSAGSPASPPAQTAFTDLSALRQISSARATAPAAASEGMQVVDLRTGETRTVYPGARRMVARKAIRYAADRDADPFEDFNRGRFPGHVRLHRYVIDPVETVYTSIVPGFARDGVHNFVTNLEGPKVFVNDLLQFEVLRAANTGTRFVINSTVGVAGLLDVAGYLGLRYRDNDFGATLANYGVGDSPYLLIPLLGPSNPRDFTGRVVDIFLSPLHYVALPGGIFTSLGGTALKELDKRSMTVGDLTRLADTASDPYAVERSQARTRRQTAIGGWSESEILVRWEAEDE